MKFVLIIGIVIAGIIGSIAIFTSLTSDTWQDKRVDIIGVAPPDENKEKIDCLSNGGTWEFASCTIIRDTKPQMIQAPDCSGTAKCITESVTQIIDGDTIYTKNYKIRLSLTNTPEKNEPRFQEAAAFTAMHCPVGSIITVDQDDLQPYDIYDRMLGKVYCEGGVINELLLSNGLANILTRYCDTSEFSGEDWA
ncbi:MAG: thermonuclease family protein, partial [Nitrosopumilus sp.]